MMVPELHADFDKCISAYLMREGSHWWHCANIAYSVVLAISRQGARRCVLYHLCLWCLLHVHAI